MAVIDKSSTAFAYAISFADIKHIALQHNYELSNTKHTDTDIVLVTGILDKTIIVESKLFLQANMFNDICYAKLLIALENELVAIRQIGDKLSRTGIILEQRKLTPIYRFKRKISYAEQLGIMPWHHMLFVGNLVYIYVWDSRIVEKVMTIQELSNLSIRMLQEPYDNNLPLIFTENTSKYLHYYNELQPTKYSVMQNTCTIDALNTDYEMPD